MQILRDILIVIAVSAITLFAGEGIYSVSRGDDLGQSLSYQIYERFITPNAVPGGPAGKDTPPVIYHESQFLALMDDFKRDGVAIGNSPFRELMTQKAELNLADTECSNQKPNADKTFTYLRTILFENFNPPLAYYDTAAELTPAVAAFIDKYAIRKIRQRNNAAAERLTLPLVEREAKAIVAGDSVANGVGVMDAETISSQLQRKDSSVQYVNIGQGGAKAHEILCKLKQAAERYAGQIRKLVYIYCENDLRKDEPYGEPEKVIAWLQDFVEKQGIEDVTIVFAPYIYNIFPEITRVEGDRGWKHKYRAAQKARLKSLTHEAGFGWVDNADIARAHQRQGKSIFAGLSLFNDLVHPSPLGNQLIAERVLAAGHSGS